MTAEEPVTVIRLKSNLAHISRGEAAYRCPKGNIAHEVTILGVTFEMAAPSRALGPRDCIPWIPRLWDQGIYASAYDEPVKYGFIVI